MSNRQIAILSLFLAFILGIIAQSTFAQTITSSTALPAQGTVTANRVNLRDRPALDSYISGKANQGDTLEILAITDDGQWLQVCCPVAGAEEVWISARYVTLVSTDSTVVSAPVASAPVTSESVASDNVAAPLPSTPYAAPAEPFDNAPEYAIRGVVRYADVNLRGGPSVSYPAIGTVQAQTNYGISERNSDNSWWLLCCPGPGETAGWIRDDMIDLMIPEGYDLAQIPISSITSPYLVTPEPTSPSSVPQPASDIYYSAPSSGSYAPSSSTNPLTGFALPSSKVNQRPVIVCINNDYAARPQWGTGRADVVYEYLMEGFGITRFSAIFYSQDASRIGPVRSARLINYYMGALYDSGILCSGANDQVRHMLHHESLFPYLDIDLDDPNNTRYSVSIGRNYRTRLRTSTDFLRRFIVDRGEERAPSIRGFTFGTAPSNGVPASTITIPYPRGTSSHVSYSYDAINGRYLRTMGGVAHVDGDTGIQISPENVIIQYITHEVTDMPEDSLGNKSIRLNLFGSGQAIVFRDGLAFVGTWSSDYGGNLPRFFDQSGYEIPLKAGTTWISVVPPRYVIGY